MARVSMWQLEGYPVEQLTQVDWDGMTMEWESGGPNLSNARNCQGRREIRPCGGAKVYHLSGDVQRKCPPTTGVVGSP